MKHKSKMADSVILPVRYEGDFCYNIRIEKDFRGLQDSAGEIGMHGHRLCIVTDSNVSGLYLEEVREQLKPVCSEVVVFEIPAGEQSKNLDEVRRLYTYLIENRFDRRDFLAALGGGVVGDLTGFAAATYMRGIRFIQIPTTLLSQVDSSIGGKTGVDFESGKNMVGAFHQPSLVYINTSTLHTLPDEQFASGMGEVLKHGLIRDEEYYEFAIEHMDGIAERQDDIMLPLIEGSCRIKRDVVEKDPKEQGERALLNFGHTIGHAIEKEKDFTLLHGQCVALGMVGAAFISMERGMISEEEFTEIRDMMVGFDLPISFDGISSESVVEAAHLDKKMDAGKIRFILLTGIGHAVIDSTVTDKEILKAVRSLNYDESF